MSIQAVILAGGRGTRLAPYTTVFPKPLMPVGGMPILELLLRQLARHQITDISLAVGYLASLLMAYFADGKRQGVNIKYCLESEPLGTAGPIKNIGNINGTFLVMNGDLLTDIDFGQLTEFHRSRGATATVGLYEKEVKIDLGVVDMDSEQHLVAYREKPTFQFNVSMGVYVLEPAALRYIPEGRRFDLPDLILALKNAGEKVVGYRHHGYWLDIGNPADYEKAQGDAQFIHKDALENP